MPGKQRQTVSLVLGSGGARGLAHIGVIQYLEEQGYRIESIAGASMGSLVGGIHAAGKLDAYRDWVCALRRADVVRFLDLAFRAEGLIKGDRIIDRLRRMVGEHLIEDLPIAYTAVATDIERRREVWLSEGPLFDAIRASIAVPTVFTPHHYRDMTLLDGGLLNPVPIAPTFRDFTDLTVAVNLNAEPLPGAAPAKPEKPPPEPSRKERSGDDKEDSLRNRILQFLDSIGDNLTSADDDGEDERVGLFELMTSSFETMQNAIAAVKLAAYAPDVLINVPRDTCGAHEFHRARELIALGRRLAAEAMPDGQR
jgi:NTE family protein